MRTSWHRGLLEEALAFFERAAEVEPEDYQALSFVAQLYEGRGDREAMVRASRVGLERARHHLDRHPEDARATIFAAFCALRLGDRERALAWAERVHQIAPEEPVHYYNLGCFYPTPATASARWQHSRSSAPPAGASAIGWSTIAISTRSGRTPGSRP